MINVITRCYFDRDMTQFWHVQIAWDCWKNEGVGEGEGVGSHALECMYCDPRGGGDTDSLSLGTDLETTAPLFGQGQPLVVPSPNVQPPFFTEAQGQPLQIVTV